LLGCHLLVDRGTSRRDPELSEWSVNGIVDGAHFRGADEPIETVSVELSPLLEWLGPAVKVVPSGDRSTLTVTASGRDYGPAHLEQGTLTAATWWGYEHVPEVLTHRASVTVAGLGGLAMDEVEQQIVGPVTDFLSFVTLGYVDRVDLSFQSAANADQAGALRRRWRVPDGALPVRSPHEMLLRPGRLPQDPAQCIADWISLSDRGYRQAMSLLVVPHRTPFMYGDTLLLTALLAFDAFQQVKFGDNVPDGEHQERVSRVVAAAPADLQEWTRRSLMGRGVKGRSRRMRELIEYAGATGLAIRGAVPDFERRIDRARGWVAHPSKHHPEKGREFYMLERSLRWLVRHALLLELGLSDDQAATVISDSMKFVEDLANIDAMQEPAID
jgi:hypothetical protein